MALFMPKYVRINLQKGSTPSAAARRQRGQPWGKADLSAGKTVGGQACSAEWPQAQVRERKAREDGSVAGRAKSFERQTPRGAADRAPRKQARGGRILRGSKARKPARMRLTAI